MHMVSHTGEMPYKVRLGLSPRLEAEGPSAPVSLGGIPSLEDNLSLCLGVTVTLGRGASEHLRLGPASDSPPIALG